MSHPGRPLDFTLTTYNVPVVSATLAEAVAAAAAADVELIPVEIPGHSGLVVLNSVRRVRCLDENRSEFLKWTAHDHRADLAGAYRQVTRLVLDGSAVSHDASFFRIQDWEVALIVSEHVKGAMEAAGCLGAKLTELPMRA